MMQVTLAGETWDLTAIGPEEARFLISGGGYILYAQKIPHKNLASGKAGVLVQCSTEWFLTLLARGTVAKTIWHVGFFRDCTGQLGGATGDGTGIDSPISVPPGGGFPPTFFTTAAQALHLMGLQQAEQRIRIVDGILMGGE